MDRSTEYPGGQRDAAASGCAPGNAAAESGGHFPTRASAAWDVVIARLVSQVGSPPVVGTVLALGLAAAWSAPAAWVWMSLYLSLAIMLPMLYLIRLVHRGQITDLDVQLRQQRARPIAFTLAATGVAWIVLVVGKAPPLMLASAGAAWFAAASIMVITRWWKISVHSATYAGAATMLWWMIGSPLPLVVGVPLVAWSRIRLRRHTPAQAVVGAALGIVIVAGALVLAQPG